MKSIKGIFYSIPESHAVIIEQFGKFDRIQTGGFNTRLPFIEKIKFVKEWGNAANKGGYLIELTEQNVDTPIRQSQTADNVTMHVDASIYWKIVDPVKAVYQVDILPKAVLDVSMNALHAVIGSMKFDEVLSKRELLRQRIEAKLDRVGTEWGVDFTRVEIKELKYSEDTADAMMQEMTAERRKRAMIAESEGKAHSEVKLAEANARAELIKAYAKAKEMKILAESEAAYIERLLQKVSSAEAISILKSHKYLDGMDKISKNPSNKVYLPNSMNNFMAPEQTIPIKGGGNISSVV